MAENEENFSVNVSRLSEALDETNTILESTSGQHKNVTDSVTDCNANKETAEKYTEVIDAVENREHTHYGAYADIGEVLDRFTTDELIRH